MSHSPRWSDCLQEPTAASEAASFNPPSHWTLGILRGEGIGPEIIEGSLEILAAVSAAHPDDVPVPIHIEFGGAMGRLSEQRGEPALPPDVIRFCERILAHNGAILSGPGGGRYVYDLRTRFDLFCKLSPIVVPPELAELGQMRPEHVRDVDLLVVREGAGGLYQGRWESIQDPAAGRRAVHTFGYTEREVQRFLGVATRLAQQRRGRLAVVYKEAGAPTISELWRETARALTDAAGVEVRFLDIDYASYCVLQQPRDFDVIAAPNLFGDILSDLGGVLLGSRALTFGGNFNATGAAFYQTNHGAAYDLAGTDRANPVGQILSLAMLLRESFGLSAAAGRIERAVRHVWSRGGRTADLTQPAERPLGLRAMVERIRDAVRELA